MTTDSLSAGPCCEMNKLIVQIAGRDHSDRQQVLLISPKDDRVYQSRPEKLDHVHYSCILEVWDHIDGAHLHLQIATIDGEPIRLPLLHKTQVTPRQADAQFNQIVPVLPFVPLPGSRTVYDLGTPVLARAGYVYVFYQEKLWRELEIQVSETGSTYHDIDVARYRRQDGFLPGERKPRGAALEDIWLPALWNNRQATAVQLCFSEVQLSAPRLERLEKDAASRSTRCKNLDLSQSKKHFTDLYKGKPDGKAMLDAFSDFDAKDPFTQALLAPIKATRLNLQHNVFPVSLAAPQRARQPGYERLLDHPARYLCDLSGQFPVESFRQARAFLAQADRGITVQNVRHLELTAMADALLASLPVEDDAEPVDAGVLWEAQTSVADVLEKARQRQVCGVLLDDACYRVRHLRQRVDTCQQLFALCARHAIRHPHHASALLVQQLVVPRNIRGQENPLHTTMAKLHEPGRQMINQCTATVQRAVVWRHMLSAQDALIDSLKQSTTEQMLADHLSLEGFDYVAAMYELSRTLATLALLPSTVDPLAPGGDMVDAVTGIGLWDQAVSPGQKFLEHIASDDTSPLHLMLWPECDLLTACAPYVVPLSDDKNMGDGRFRATELARFETRPAPDPVTQVTLDATTLANLLAGDNLQNFFLINNGKATTAALIGIFENLQSASDGAANAVAKANQALASAKGGLKSTHANAPSANDRLAKIQERLGANTHKIDVKRQGRGVQQLRSMMPEHFAAAFLTRRNKVTAQHYVFGLEDLPGRESLPKTRYGEYLRADGTPFGDIAPPPPSSTRLTQGDNLVLVIPRGHKTAQVVGDMNRTLKTAREAADAVGEAQRGHIRAKSGLSEAIEGLDSERNKAAYKVLGSTSFCLAVLMLEVWNVSSEYEALEQTAREKNDARAIGGIGGAYLDMAIAIEALAVKLAGQRSSLSIARKTLFNISSKKAATFFGEALAKKLTEKVTGRMIGIFFSGGILSVVNAIDTWHAWQWNDQAMYGYLLISLGGLAGSLGTLFGAAGTLLGLTVLGWAALLLIGAGVGLVILMSSTPLESWLANGPFGESHSIDSYLQDPSQAFYRLTSLLAGISISIEKNPVYEPHATFDYHAQIPHAIRSADTIIRLQSRLPGLIGSLDSLSIQADCRLCRVTEKANNQGVPYRAGIEIADRSETPQAQRLQLDALELFFATPANQVSPTGSSRHHYQWAVRAQFILSRGGEKLYFPGPPVKDPTQYSQDWATPNFKKTNQPFWADEETHKIFSNG
ncbi:toxin VasX [Pseudomonas coronafaciens]|uniref:toxin VasX n=1 Tax=Pseudomonas coronafaciens TaxID=53409 RepID=UPI000EFDD52D|nr:toxin VasX [Pseudomonas coronafaciens]RMV66380.1 Transposase [Pseudomonas coronafaciens pv. atropurpurea]